MGVPLEKFWVVDDPLFDQHRARGYHPERPERLVAARQALADARAAGLTATALTARDATADEIGRVHHASYVDALEALRGKYAALDDDTYLAPASVSAAYRAAGGGVALVDALLRAGPDEPRKGVALLRPPGHHARPDRGMGFCLLNNVAIAARHALASGLSRVAIVDFDVHHGNGTQDAFYDEPRVLFTSLHQSPFYPGTGAADETGLGDGTGFTVNVPLSQAAHDATYAAAFGRLVEPVLEAYRPELVLVSAGFDAHARDPLAGMSLSADAYATMTRAIARVAQRSAGGKVALFLEGGYDLEGLSSSLAQALLALGGATPGETASASPVERADEATGAPLSLRHSIDLDRALEAAAATWSL